MQSDLPLDEQMSFATNQSADSLTSLDRVRVVCCVACVSFVCTVQYVCLCLFVHMTVIKVRTCVLVSWLCCPSAGACCCTAS